MLNDSSQVNVNIQGLNCLKAFPLQSCCAARQPVKIVFNVSLQTLKQGLDSDPTKTARVPQIIKHMDPITGSESHKTRGKAALIRGKAKGNLSLMRVIVQKRAFVLIVKKSVIVNQHHTGHLVWSLNHLACIEITSPAGYLPVSLFLSSYTAHCFVLFGCLKICFKTYFPPHTFNAQKQPHNALLVLFFVYDVTTYTVRI